MTDTTEPTAAEAAAKAAAEAAGKTTESPEDKATREAAEAAAAAAAKTDDDPANWDPDRAKRTIEAQRAAEEQLQAKLKERDDKIAAYEREKLTEEQRKDADLTAAKEARAELERENRELKVDGTFRAALTEAGIPLARFAAAKAVVTLDVDEHGKVTNLAEQIEHLKTDHAYLLGDGKGGGSGGGKVPPKEGGGNAGDGSFTATNGVTLSPEQVAVAKAAGITPEKYAANL